MRTRVKHVRSFGHAWNMFAESMANVMSYKEASRADCPLGGAVICVSDLNLVRKYSKDDS